MKKHTRNNYNLIIEGPDCVGKGTFIKELKKQIHSDAIIHFGKPPKDEKDPKAYQKNIFETEMSKLKEDRCIIYDRFHLGEYVYGPTRGYTGNYIYDLEEKYLTKKVQDKTLLIVFTASPEKLSDRDDGFSIYKNKEKEVSLFYEAYKKSNISKKFYMDIGNDFIPIQLIDVIKVLLLK